MVLEFMDQEYLRTKGVEPDEPAFETDYRLMRKIYGRKGRMPEGALLFLAFRQFERVAAAISGSGAGEESDSSPALKRGPGRPRKVTA